MTEDLRTTGVYTMEEIEESKRWRGTISISVMGPYGSRMQFYRASSYTRLVNLLSNQEIIPINTDRLGICMEETIGEYQFRSFPDIIHSDIIVNVSICNFTDVVYIPHFSNLGHLTISNCGKFNFAVVNGYDWNKLRTLHIHSIPEIRSVYVAPNLIGLNFRQCHVAHITANGDGRDLDCYRHEGIARLHWFIFKDTTFDYDLSECLDERPTYYGPEWSVLSLHQVMETAVSKNFMQSAFTFNAFRNRNINHLVKEYTINPRSPVGVIPGAIVLASNPIRRALEYICLY